MASNYILERAVHADQVREIAFAGDCVRLSGQINYPQTHATTNGTYPLIFVLPHAGCCSRAEFDDVTRLGLDAGYAVFRWDKRGTGRSGAGGRGSTTQDAVNAYEAALSQPRIDTSRVIFVAQGEGSLMLGQSFGLFARIRTPVAVLLTANMLDPEQILAIDAPVQIINSEDDWHDWQHFARDVRDAHVRAYTHGAFYHVTSQTDRFLINHYGELDVDTTAVIRDWFESF